MILVIVTKCIQWLEVEGSKITPKVYMLLYSVCVMHVIQFIFDEL